MSTSEIRRIKNLFFVLAMLEAWSIILIRALGLSMPIEIWSFISTLLLSIFVMGVALLAHVVEYADKQIPHENLKPLDRLHQMEDFDL